MMASPMAAPKPIDQPYTIHSATADAFLNAKAQSSRRSTSSPYDRERDTSRRPSSPLASVPENHQHQSLISDAASTSVDRSSAAGTPPPSAFRLQDATANLPGRRVQSDKGKHRERSHITPVGSIQQQQPIKQRRADWVMDLVQVESGSESWAMGSRIILVLGNPSPSSLAPLLYNPAFAKTLVLVGTTQPIPAIEALLSASYSMSASLDQTIYPILQTFTPTSGTQGSEAHVLTHLLAQGTALAQQFKFRSRPNGRRSVSNDATGSSTSATNSPPIRKRVLSGLGLAVRGTSDDSEDGSRHSSRRSSTTEIPRSDMLKVPASPTQSATSQRDASDRPSASRRISSFGRTSIVGGLSKLTDASDVANTNTNLFDAVINFIPPMSLFQNDRALQEMLHQAVVVTTGVMPQLARLGKIPSSSDAADETTTHISLLHVLPKQVPGPLPSVVESFLLSLLPRFQARCEQELFGCVLTTAAWRAPTIETGPVRLSVDREVSGAEALLFGGVRCLHNFSTVQGEQGVSRSRAFLPEWAACLPMPGLIADSRQPNDRSTPTPTRSSYPSTSPTHRRRDDPPSIAFSDVAARTPPQSFDAKVPPPEGSRLPPRSFSQPHLTTAMTQTQSPRRSKLSNVASASDIPNSPPTPDLETSVSSCGSSFALGEVNSSGSTAGHGVITTSQRNSSDAPISGSSAGAGGSPGAIVKEKKKGLSGWLRGKKSKA